MRFRATLPMYDWPEAHTKTDAFYTALRALVPELPANLTRPVTGADLHAIWRDPALVLGQTCWGPLHAGLGAHVHVLAQPDYSDVPGGQGARYRSAVVMRAGLACAVPDHDRACLPQGLAQLRAAINAPDSLSGCIALAQDMGQPDFMRHAVVIGSHRAALRAVAKAEADFAAIDCRSWAMALRYEPAAQALVVVGWTALRPGLPFITSRTTPPDLRARMADALARLGAVALPQTEIQETP